MNSITYPYLSDLRFLKELDELNIKEQFVKIIVLDWLENPIANIEGRVSGGSMNLDGSSAVRRSGSITFICDDEYYNVLDVNNLISINKKIKIEIGYANTTDKYTEYNKIWFPQGVFVIINPSITHNNQGLSIAISFKDKMCLLNGECGGVLPASVTFHEREEEDGTITRVTYYQIIRELVSEFGGEQLGKIIINDVDTRIKKVMKWVGDEEITLQGASYSTSRPFALDGRGLSKNFEAEELCLPLKISLPPCRQDENKSIIPNTLTVNIECETNSPDYSFNISLYKENSKDFFAIATVSNLENSQTATCSFEIDNSEQADIYVVVNLINAIPTYYGGRVIVRNDNPTPVVDRCQPQEDIGYIYTDFCPTSDLVGNAGQNVVTILDNIKKQLGNYEYFYDIDGNFIFQEIRNYLNTSQSTNEFQPIQYTPDGYLFQPNASKSVYSFKDSSLITAYQNTPQFANIKNDYIVWGTRESASGAKLPIRYHLALDTKPAVGNTYGCITQTDEFGYESITNVMQEAAMKEAIKTDEQRVGRPSTLYHQVQEGIKTYYQFKAALVGRSSSFMETDGHFIFSFDNIPLSQEKWYLLEFHECAGNYSGLPFGDKLTTDKTDLLPRITTDSGSRPKLIAGIYDPDIPVGQQAYIEPEAMCFYFDNTIQKRNSLQSVKLTRHKDLASFNSTSYVTVYSFDTVGDWRKIGDGSNYKIITTQDYRTELYLQGVMAEALGENKNRYYTELAGEWPKLFKLKEKPEPDSTSAPVMLKAASPRAPMVQVTLDYGFADPEDDENSYSITISRVVGQPYGALPTIKREGFKFQNWVIANEQNGEDKITSDTLVSISTDHILKAKWEKITVLYGDCNGDGAINAKDAVLLAQHLAGWGVDIDTSAADCNSDGAINAKDAVLLAQKLANWDVTLGPSDNKPWTIKECSITKDDFQWEENDNHLALQFAPKDLDGAQFNFFLISFEILEGDYTASEEWNVDGRFLYREWPDLTDPSPLPTLKDIEFTNELTIIKLMAIEGVNSKTSTMYYFDPRELPTIANTEYYTITLESSSTTEEDQTLYCQQGSAIELPKLKDTSTQTFKGWYNNGEKIEVNENGLYIYKPEKDVVLQGQWESTYWISIQTIPGDSSIEKAVTLGKQYGAYLGPDPIREDYVFCGWYFKNGTEEISKKAIQEGDFPTDKSPLEIEAKWQNELIITFNTQGGALQMAPRRYRYSGSNQTYTILNEELIKPFMEGYTFIGWQDQKNATFYDKEEDITITLPDNKNLSIELKAVWELPPLSVIDVPVATDLSELDIDYYLDLIDVQSKISEFNIPSIGVRSKVWSDNAVNCIFEKTPPDIILIEAGRGKATQDERDYCEKQGDSYYQVPSSVYNALAGGGYQNSAFNAIRDVLYQYTNYNESITLTALPIYYLEPNTRITVEDEKSSIHGDYMIKSISRPFDCNGTMQITATKALERF